MTIIFPTFDFGDGVSRQIRPKIRTIRRIMEISGTEDLNKAMSGREMIQNLPEIVTALLSTADRKEITPDIIDDLDASRLDELTGVITQALTAAFPDAPKNLDASKNEQSGQPNQ